MQSRPRLVRVAGTLLVALVGLVAVACSSGSSSKGSSNTVGAQATLPKSTGYICKDPTGDIALGQTGPATASQPAGIDIITASALIHGDQLDVSFTTAGPIASAPSPLFVVDSGDPTAAPQTSFELRAEMATATTWKVTLHTFSGPKEATKDLDVPVTVTANMLSYSVPLAQIPPVVSIQWQFGATSIGADGAVSVDTCDSFSSGSTTTTAH